MTRDKELQQKQKRLKELSVLINMMSTKLVPKTVTSEVDNLKSRLEFRLVELVEEFKIKEADAKISIFEEVVKLLKEN